MKKECRLQGRLNLKASVIEEVYTLIANIDSVKKSWHIAGQLLPQTIERLTRSVIVTSTGSSNRIEGNVLSDQDVEALYKNLHVKKFKTRDEQEIAGYLECLECVFEHFEAMTISESTLLKLHHDMLVYCDKDARNKGRYKSSSNRVEAKDHKGNVVGVIFDPTPPYLVQKEMHELMEWYKGAVEKQLKHPLILIANFIFEYLAIHPFHDGNGRTSRLITNAMLLQHGYFFTAIVSHERLIETHKIEYYRALHTTQNTWKTENEDLSAWLLFFLKIINFQAEQALKIMEGDTIDYLLSEKQRAVWQWILSQNGQEFSRKSVIDALGFPARTVEACIKKLYDLKKLERLGEGQATRYRRLTEV